MDKNLLKALLCKVEDILKGGSDIASASSDNYVAWCSPGIPFQATDLQFAVKGINGKDAEETNTLIRSAAEFSRLANSIPSSNMMGGTFEQAGSILWDIYGKVLTLSKVAQGSITEEEKKKIEKFRNLLVTTNKVKDILTDEEKEVIADSPLVASYKEKMAAYESAVLEYNNKRLSALNGDSKVAVQDFTMNAPIYRNKVKQALTDWTTNGYKTEYEQIGAYIKQVSQRDMSLIKADLEDKLEKAKMTDPNTGGDFCMTSLYPGSFINSDAGWTQFTFSSANTDSYIKDSHQSSVANTQMTFGLFKLNADAKHTKDELNTSMDSDDFEMKFKLVQVPLGRPWFSPDFLTNNAWDWAQEGQKPLSDGGDPAQGQMIAYPTTAVFIKDISIRSSALKEAKDKINSSLDAGGSVGWGPFSIGGRHSRNSEEIKSHIDTDTNTLTVEGMQLIAFKCFALPKTPDCKVENLQ